MPVDQGVRVAARAVGHAQVALYIIIGGDGQGAETTAHGTYYGIAHPEGGILNGGILQRILDKRGGICGNRLRIYGDNPGFGHEFRVIFEYQCGRFPIFLFVL